MCYKSTLYLFLNSFLIVVNLIVVPIIRVVPPAGLEPARLATSDFESDVSTIPPRRHVCKAEIIETLYLKLCEI